MLYCVGQLGHNLEDKTCWYAVVVFVGLSVLGLRRRSELLHLTTAMLVTTPFPEAVGFQNLRTRTHPGEFGVRHLKMTAHEISQMRDLKVKHRYSMIFIRSRLN